MPQRRLPRTFGERDKALTACNDKVVATPPAQVPFSGARITDLATNQPLFHSLIVAANNAKTNQTTQSALVAPMRHISRLWVSHGFQALINACIREQFPNAVKNYYGIPLDSSKVPVLSSDSDITQAAITYNDGEAARTAAGGVPITFPLLADINAQVDTFKAALQVQSTLKGLYDTAQENLTAANPAIDLLILQLWNSIEATFDTGDKPSMRRKAREWGVVYIPSPGETPSGDDYSVIGKVTDSVTGLPLANVNIKLQNGPVIETYVTDEDGMYFLPPVETGNYDLSADLAGHMPFMTPVAVVDGEVQEMNISLNPLIPPVPPGE